MLPLPVGLGRLDVVLVLLGTLPALTSAPPLPMDDGYVEAVANELFQNGLGGFVSRYPQHGLAPASAPHAKRAANPNVFHQASQFGDSHSSSETQGTGWTVDGHLQRSMQEWRSLLYPADPATTVRSPGAPAQAQVQLDLQDSSASGLLDHRVAYGGSQANLAGSSRAVPQSGSSSRSQLATLLDPALVRAVDQTEAVNLLESRGANTAFETSQFLRGRDSAVASTDYLVGPSYGHMPRNSEHSGETTAVRRAQTAKQQERIHEPHGPHSGRDDRRAQPPVTGPRQEVKSISDRRAMAERLRKKDRDQLDQIERVDDAEAVRLFGEKQRRTDKDRRYFQAGTSEQRAWVLERFHRLSRTQHDESNWLDGAQSVPALGFAEAKVVLQTFRSARSIGGGPFQRYIVGDRVVLFQQKRSQGSTSGPVYFVFALPIDWEAEDPVGYAYRIELIGALRTLVQRTWTLHGRRNGRRSSGPAVEV